MNIDVAIEGRGQSYKQHLSVDPKESLDQCLRNKTHFWKTFMARGQQKCLVVVSNKNEEDIIVAPDFLNKCFQDIGVTQGADIILHDMKNIDMYSDGDEGGEEEHEEMEHE